MKREFLQNFKVGDQPLSKEIIDAIMEENGRDIEAAKKPFADYDSIKDQLKTAQDGLKAFDGVDVAQLQAESANRTQDLADQDTEWTRTLAAQEVGGKVKDAIVAAKGKSPKAIAALLDITALKESKNQDADIKSALENLKKESGYLFEEQQAVPPPYAGGTGGAPVPGASKYTPEEAAIRAAAGLKNE